MRSTTANEKIRLVVSMMVACFAVVNVLGQHVCKSGNNTFEHTLNHISCSSAGEDRKTFTKTFYKGFSFNPDSALC